MPSPAPVTQRVHILALDDQPQFVDGQQLSQKSAYQSLDRAFLENAMANLNNRSHQKLSQYIQEMLTYPENCWQGNQPKDLLTGAPIIVMPPLDADRLYPKARALLDILHDQRQRGRKCLVQCTHTGRCDTTARLARLVGEEGFRVLVLHANTTTIQDRPAWLRRKAADHDLIICHPNLSEAGINILEYSTIVWYEIDYSISTVKQASARSQTIQRNQPVEIHWLAYKDTIQETTLRIVSRKMGG